jgi:hybrid cluster-associated redox disulfide protein
MHHYSPDMLISDVLQSDPQAASVFTRLGLGCPSCIGADMETLASVASMHDVPVGQLLDALEAVSSESDEERS